MYFSKLEGETGSKNYKFVSNDKALFIFMKNVV